MRLSVQPVKRRVPSWLQARNARRIGLFGFVLETGRRVFVEFSNDSLGFQIPNLDSVLGSSAEPISGRRKDERIDDISSFEGVEGVALVQIPETSSSILASRSAESSVGRDSHSVDKTRVANQIVSELAVGKIPDFDEFVPTSRDDHGVGSIRRESNTADPFSVAVLVDGVFAFSEGIPELDGFVSRTRDDLSVISRESNAQDVLRVANESSSGGSKIEIPESKSAVPRSRQSKLSIGRDNNVGDEVVVSSQSSSRGTELFSISG